MANNLLVQSFFDLAVVRLFQKILRNARSSESQLQVTAGYPESQIYQIELDEAFAGATYLTLYQALSGIGIIPIGLLRAAEPSNAPLPYVNAGPTTTTVLHRGDKVFVLSVRPPSLLDVQTHI